MKEIRDERVILGKIVDEIGYLDDEIIRYVAKRMDVFETTIYSSVNFFPKLQKAYSKRYIEICTGSCCLDKKIIEKLEKSDATVVERKCLGICKLKNNVKIDGKIYQYKNYEELKEKI